MIKCPNCNADNQLGAIFCRSCGERINIDEITPTDIKKTASKGKMVKAVTGGLRNLIGLAVLVVVGGALAAIFLTPTYTIPDDLSAAQVKVAKQRLGKLMRARKGEFVFTDAEASMIAREVTNLTEDAKLNDAETEGPALAPDNITVNFLAPNQIRIVLKSIIKEKVDMYSVIQGGVTVGSNGIIFTPVKTYAGKLPVSLMGQFGMQKIYDRFLPLIDNNRYDKFNRTVLKKAKEVRIENGKITIRK